MMTITVTQEDIDGGSKGSPYCCPIANACKKLDKEKATAEKSGVSVGETTIRLGGLYTDLPHDACQFIADFDAGKPVKPFTFELPTT